MKEHIFYKRVLNPFGVKTFDKGRVHPVFFVIDIGGWNHSSFAVCARDLGYNDNDVITFTDAILDESGKRINNEQVQVQLTNKIQENRKQIAGIEKDILDGWERFQQLTKVKDYYRSLYKQFCRDSQHKLERDCEIKGVSLWGNF